MTSTGPTQEHPGMTMETGHDPTGERLAAQASDLAALSARYARRGDARCAALAVWAADLRVVQGLLWERGPTGLEDPARHLPAVTVAVETALLGRETPAEPTVRAVVESARHALLTVFDESVHGWLVDHFAGLDHLDDLPAPLAGAANEAVAARLGGRGPEQLVSDLLTATEDSRAVAEALARAGDEDEARRQAELAELAAFEAYLVLVSAASGDATLATTELRWDLAAVNAEVTPARSAMRSAVVPDEEDALVSLLGPGRQAGPE